MADDEDLLAFDVIERIGKSQKATKPAQTKIKASVQPEAFPKPAAWVSTKKRRLPSDVQSPEGSDSVQLLSVKHRSQLSSMCAEAR